MRKVKMEKWARRKSKQCPWCRHDSQSEELFQPLFWENMIEKIILAAVINDNIDNINNNNSIFVAQ